MGIQGLFSGAFSLSREGRSGVIYWPLAKFSWVSHERAEKEPSDLFIHTLWRVVHGLHHPLMVSSAFVCERHADAALSLLRKVSSTLSRTGRPFA
jgi:hypothetical protein